jgi:hypothetical protein
MHTKQDILKQLDNGLAALDTVLDGVDEVHGTWEGAVGTWSIVNVLQHIDGWLQEMTPGLQRLAAGERPTPEGVDYSDFDKWNAGFVADHGEQTLAQARAALLASHAQFRAAADSVADARYGDGKTVNRLVDGTAVEHYEEHAAHIQAFLAG